MTFFLESALLLTVLFGMGSSPQQGQQAPIAPVTVPPPEAKYWAAGLKTLGRVSDTNGYVFCRFMARTDTRSASFFWTWAPVTTNKTLVQSKALNFTVRSWPTATAGSTGLDAFIAGVRTTNLQPVIEKWTFKPPTRETDSSGEEPVYSLSPGNRQSSEVVWTSTDLEDLVSKMSSLPVADGPSKVVLFFPKKKRLSVLDTSQGTLLDLAVADTSTGGGLHVPGLRDDYDSLKVLDHASSGFLYVLTGTLGTDPAMVIVDANRNGAIDSADYALEADAQAWASLGWGNPDNYIKH